MSQTFPPDDENASSPGGAESPSFSPEDALPPVEAPGAGFLLQLFIVPAVIVLVIVMVWLMFSWIARGTDDPKHLIAQLRSPTVARNQAANLLANQLRDSRSESLRTNATAAREISQILKEELDKGDPADAAVNFRIFLCRALGEFHVDDGLDVLVQAAFQQKHDDEVHVRKHAISAIAVRAEYAGSQDPPRRLDSPGLTEAMLKLADDPEYMVRGATAVAISWMGQDVLQDKLREMLDDSYPDVRFNAALNCARLGDAKAIDVLVEMLDPENAGVMKESNEKLRPQKRTDILFNAMRAVELLSKANPDADLSPLEPALVKLSQADVDKQITTQATGALYRLRESSQ